MVCFLNSPSNNKVGMENAGLSEFSKHTLREMCSQDWVREKFLRDPETLFTPEMLLDSMLSNEQVSIYSKTCLKRSLKEETKIDFQDRLSLNAAQKYCRMLQESILQYFRPSLSYHLSLRPLFCPFLSGCLRQVSLYMYWPAQGMGTYRMHNILCLSFL